MKKILALGAVLILLAATLASCTITGNGNTSTSDNTVGMDSRNFIPGSITIKKGESITLQNQEATTHIIANGTWQGSVPDSQAEPGAPVVNNATISSANQTLAIGPFNTAGTFHYYCMVHDDMNLTVIVQ
ncbi:MAG TPA: plastocyanin/azurin family copper-binding protein [Ktedonobacteraceae bacterium]